MIGQQFGKWTVLRFSHRAKGNHDVWICSCGGCGKERPVYGRNLTRGQSTECRQCSNEKKVKHGHSRAGSVTSTYRIWCAMRQRCEDSNHRSYRRYGGRGVSVCLRWHDYSSFLADMGEAPRGLELDRIDNDGNYEPGNCRWATRRANQQNRGNLRLNAEAAKVIRHLYPRLARNGIGGKGPLLAGLYGVSTRTLYSISRGLMWSQDVDNPAAEAPTTKER